MSEEYGTGVGDDLFKRSKTGAWGNPLWDDPDVCAGGVMPGEAQLLYGLVRALRPDFVLEVGTSHGYSTLHFAAGCRDNQWGKVHTVEIHQGRYEDATRNIEQAGLSDWVEQHHSLLDDFPLVEAFQLVFLDAGHTASEVKGYLNKINEYTNEDTLILIHDALWEDHVRAALSGTGWAAIFLHGTSFAGLALLARRYQK